MQPDFPQAIIARLESRLYCLRRSSSLPDCLASKTRASCVANHACASQCLTDADSRLADDRIILSHFNLKNAQIQSFDR
eukprot:scaffold73488_cov31-Prasinocladus_malaysianus.AAC.1